MSPSESVSNRTAINEHIGDWFDQATAPGISVAVVSSSEQLYIDSFGSRDRESNAPVTPETVFGVGSCTKSLTALAVLKLVETGTISLEDPVTKYLPDLEAIVDEGITIHDLLSHGSGMPSDGYLYSLLTQLTDRGSAQHTVNLANKADFHNHIAKFADNRVTDDEWRFYYNTGFALLGEVIETCSGLSYAEYVKKRILNPLQMTRSFFSRDTFETETNRIKPYRLSNGTLIEDNLPFDELLYAAGGLCSCAVDMATYVQMLLRGGEINGHQVVSENLVSKMTTGTTYWSTFLDGTEKKYGYGVFTEPFLQDTLVSHRGMMETTTSWMGFLDNADRGVFIACNTTPDRSLRSLGQSILALTQDFNPDTVVPERMLDRKIEPLLGTYKTVRGSISVTVMRHAGGVRIDADNPGWRQEYVATPRSLDPTEHEFHTIGADGAVIEVSFVVSDDETKLRLGKWQLHQ